MTCPECGTVNLRPSTMTITFVFDGQPAVRREYHCWDCDHAFTTVEVVAEDVEEMRRQRFRAMVDRTMADAKLAISGVLA